MAISKNIHDREFAKFSECDGKTVVNVEICQEPGDSITVDSSKTTAGLDSLLTLSGGVTISLKVGSSEKSNRKFVKIQAKGSGIKFGFTNPATTFDAFKDQLIILPFSNQTIVYITNTTGSDRQVAIGEV